MRCAFAFFFFKQKTAYEMRISDWSSDVCSSDLLSQIANAARPSIVVCSGKAHLFPGCAAVEQGTTVTAPCSVFLNDTVMTGRRFQNSGRSDKGSGGKECVGTCRYRW